ncbi:MAG: tetratricopeptide repeat protein [Verrucomicrobia bacterium]|nr:tetratricopeptide repeat protein [Verrucomicrobiota bacterium]
MKGRPRSEKDEESRRSVRHKTTGAEAVCRPCPTGLRLWGYRLVGAVVLPVLLLGLFEAGLRLAGYGYNPAFFKRARLQDRDCLVANDKFGLSFFTPEAARNPPPIVLDAKKESGTFRIFLIGESAALGDPRPAFGMGRYLEVLLAERYPDVKFEVVCASMTAVNSHALLPIARECAKLGGDLWIVYAGNNEMIGPFGPASVFGQHTPNLFAIRLGLAVKRTRLGQFIDSLARRVRTQDNKKTPWAGMSMFLEQRLPPDDPRRDVAHRHFAANVEDMLRIAQRTKTPVLLCTVGSNLRDCAPFASMHSKNCSSKDALASDALAKSAVTNESAGNLTAAIAALEHARQLDAGFAEVQFRLGQCLLRSGDQASAAVALADARDCDALPFRADATLNKHVRDLASKHADRKVFLVDSENLLRSHAQHEIPGSELFFEHVHFTFAGNYLIARMLADAIEKNLAPLPGRKTPDWATQENCDRLLGLTDWNRIGVIENVLKRLQAPPFVQQVNHEEQVERCRAQLHAIRSRLAAQQPSEIREVYRKALLRRPRDHYLYENFAEFLEATGDIDGAIAQWEAICSMLPEHFVAHVHAGRLLARRQQWSAAEERLRTALKLEPRSPEGHLELGKVLAERGMIQSAIDEYNAALRWGPGNATAYFHMADALAKLGKRSEATEALSKAVQLQPSFWEARYLLGVELAMNNKLAEAQHQFEQTIRWRPNHVLAHLNLGVAYALQGRLEAARLEFQETLKLDPQNQKAREHLARIEAMLGKQPRIAP